MQYEEISPGDCFYTFRVCKGASEVMLLMWDRGKGSQRDKAGQQQNSYILWSGISEDNNARRPEREVLLGDTAGAEAAPLSNFAFSVLILVRTLGTRS